MTQYELYVWEFGFEEKKGKDKKYIEQNKCKNKYSYRYEIKMKYKTNILIPKQ